MDENENFGTEKKIIIKEEDTTDQDYEAAEGEPFQFNSYDDYILTTKLRNQNEATKENVAYHASHKRRRLKKIAFGDKKKRLAKIMKEYPFLWDKNHEFHRNRQKREEAWWKVAAKLKITTLEVKALWKKLKDTHRYLSSKAKKKSQFNPDDFCDDQDDEHDILDDLAFLDDNFSNSLHDTPPLLKDSTSQRNVPDQLNMDDCNFDDNSDICTFMDPKRLKLKERPEEIPSAVAQSSSSNFELRRNKGSDSNSLKHMHIWMQLEKLFEKLDDEQITDLNFLFVSETYKAILDNRKNR